MKLDVVAADAARHARPRHAMWELYQRLDASLHEPGSSPATLGDKMRALVFPTESMWSFAREVSASATDQDAIFCSSEAAGLQVAATLGTGRSRARLAVFVHNVDRPRARAALKLWRLSRSVDLFMACSPEQVAFLRGYLGLPPERVRLVWDHTDTSFFKPGPVSPDKRRPMILSVGLEQRDYKTLAAATFDLDVDVRISGFSNDAKAIANTFPAELPSNMSRRYYDWLELVQLYRDADVVVVSCYENRYAAGVQSLMEAMACGRPVIASATRGLSGYLDAAVVSVPPSDPWAMRREILNVLQDPTGSATRGAAAHELATAKFALDRYVSEIVDAMMGLASTRT